MWSYLWHTAQHAKDEALRMFGEYVITLPIATPTAQKRDEAAREVEHLVRLTQAQKQAQTAILDVLRAEYDIEKPGPALLDVASLNLDSDAFVREVKARRRKGGKPFTPDSLSALRQLYDSTVPGLLAGRAEILVRERSLAAQVHAAYGLSAEDLALLAQTAPPRMPPGFAE